MEEAERKTDAVVQEQLPLEGLEREEKIAATDTLQKPLATSGTGTSLPQLRFKSRIPSSTGSKAAASLWMKLSSSLETTKAKDWNFAMEETAGTFIMSEEVTKLQPRVENEGANEDLTNGSTAALKPGKAGDSFATLQIQSALSQPDGKQSRGSHSSFRHKQGIKPGETSRTQTRVDRIADSGKRGSHFSGANRSSSEQSRSVSGTLNQSETIKEKSPKIKDKLQTDAIASTEGDPLQLQITNNNNNNNGGRDELTIAGNCPEMNSTKTSNNYSEGEFVSQERSNELECAPSPLYLQVRWIPNPTNPVEPQMPDLVFASLSRSDQMPMECEGEGEERGVVDSEVDYFVASQSSMTSSLGILNENDIFGAGGFFAPESFNDGQPMSAENLRMEDNLEGSCSGSESDVMVLESEKMVAAEIMADMIYIEHSDIDEVTDGKSDASDTCFLADDGHVSLASSELLTHSDELNSVCLQPVNKELPEDTVLTEEEIPCFDEAESDSFISRLVDGSGDIEDEENDNIGDFNSNAASECVIGKQFEFEKPAVIVEIQLERELMHHLSIASDFLIYGSTFEEDYLMNMEANEEMSASDEETFYLNAGKGKELEEGSLDCVASSSKETVNLKNQHTAANEQRGAEVKSVIKFNHDKERKLESTSQFSSRKASNLQKKLKKAESFQNSPVMPKTVVNTTDSGIQNGNLRQRPRTFSLDLGTTDNQPLSSSSSVKQSSKKREAVQPKKSVGTPEIDEKQTEKMHFQRKSPQRSAVVLDLADVSEQNEMPSKLNSVSPGAKNASVRRLSTPALAKFEPASKVTVGESSNRRGLQHKPELRNKKVQSTSGGSTPGKGQVKQRTAVSAKSGKSSEESKEMQSQPQTQHRDQPDLVPSESLAEKQKMEVNRLESLCQSYSVQINSLKLEVSRRNDWFHALLIVAQYLLQLSDSEERSHLRNHLYSTIENLNASRKQLEELTRQRDTLIGEIHLLKEEEEMQKTALIQEHQLQLKELEERLHRLHSENMSRITAENAQKVSLLEMEHLTETNNLKEQQEQELNESEKEHSAKIAALNSEHEEIFRGLKQQQDHQLSEITLIFDHMKLSLSEKVEILRNECEEMRRREATYMESCQREMEQKLHLALLPYRHLPQEIESLKSVLELRNVELHSLRHQNLELQRQLEELPVANEMIRRLEQKVENLEAVIKIRSDYERELSEKHQQLLRRFERESKVNKRLSMDKEELLWRLSSRTTDSSPSTETFSLESFQQFLNNTPTGRGDSSMAGDASKSPLRPISSSSPTAPTCDVRLRRSGTYDLLCQTLEEAGANLSLPEPK